MGAMNDHVVSDHVVSDHVVSDHVTNDYVRDGGPPHSAQRLRELFAHVGARVQTRPLQDFAQLWRGADTFCEVWPASVEEVRAIVRLARLHDIPLRTRGQGHALNGSSLPSEHELVIQTGRLCTVRFGREGTVTAGAGVVMWALRDLLAPYGYTLPVVNDGYAGPSLGGYVAAGGFGPGSAVYGGFWENVAELEVVDGHGALQRVTRDDPLFPWFFGAMGQIGIVVGVTLDIVPARDAGPVSYPRGAVAAWTPTLADEARRRADPPANERGRRLYWFTLFVPEGRLDEARRRIAHLEARHAGTFEYRERYLYSIPFRRVVAPLVYPHAEPCVALGAWGFHQDATLGGIANLRAFERDFMELTLRHGYRRYIQSELPCGPDGYARYFGPDLYARLRAVKGTQDPAALFNRGWVFPAPRLLAG